MDSNWEFCLKAILVQEGGNDDDPQDHGGRTSRGIVQREYDAYRKGKGEALGDVWKASDEEIADIYRTQYWRPFGPVFPSGVDLMYFNFDVNAGVVEAAKILQRALGVSDDGHIGLITLSALKEASPIRLITKMADEEDRFYRSLRQFGRYGRGWLRRDKEIEQQALQLAAQSAIAPAIAASPPKPSAPPETTSATGIEIPVLSVDVGLPPQV